MRELDRVVVPNAEDIRREELASLDILESECWRRFHDPAYSKSAMFSVDRILACKERRAKLMGLDVPTGSNIAANMVVVREVPPGYLGAPQP